MRKLREKKNPKKNRILAKKRTCRFCADKKMTIDFKEPKLLQPFLTERGRIVPRRISGNCSQHQREVTFAIKRGRLLALLPFSATQASWSATV